MSNVFMAKINNPYLGILLDKINPSHEPVYVNLNAVEGAAINECFDNVKTYVERNGGRRILGWNIWISKYLIEAEAHAVWEDMNGELHDLTPKADGETTVLFVEDDNLEYNERQINNHRYNITHNKLVNDFILLYDERFHFLNRGDRAKERSIILTPILKNHLKRIDTLLGIVSFILEQGGNRNSKCACGSKRNFDKCHGYNLKSQCREVL